MSTKVAKAATAAPKKTRLTAAERAKAMKAKAAKAAKTSATRLTEADKALDTDVYILNPVTNKHVKRTSVVGQQILAGKTPEKNPTPAEVLTSVVAAIQQIDTNVLTDAAIKDAIGQIAGVPRTFPSKWGGRGRKPRPEGKPKGPQNAYIIFATEMRPKVRKDNPNVPNSAKKGETSITSIIGQLWEQLKDRSEYEQKAKADLERYEREMAPWEAANPEHARKANAPKKQTRTNGYRVYCDQHREASKKANPDKNGREINSILAEDWNKLTDEQQQPYKDQAEERNKDLPETERRARATGELSAAERAKANDPDTYILNPTTGRYVKRTSKPGRKAERANDDTDLLEEAA